MPTISYSQGCKTVQKALTASEQMYRDLVEMAHEGITMVDSRDNLTFVNKQFARSLGYKVKELIGRSLFTLATKPSAARLAKEMEKRRKGKKSRYEVTLIHRDGSEKCFWLSASPLYGPSHEFTGSIGVYSDVTEKKAMEQKLENKVKHINTLYKVYSHARMVNSLSVVLKKVSREIVHAFPFSEQVQSKLVFDRKIYSYPVRLKRFVTSVKVPLIIDGVKRGTIQIGYKSKVSTLVRGDFPKEEKELVKNVAKILCKHLHAREILTRYQDIVRKSFTAIIIVRGQKIVFANPRFHRMFDCREAQVIGRKIQHFFPKFDPTICLGTKVRECLGRQTSGELFDTAIITQSIYHNGSPAVLIRVSDISALKKAQKKLANFNSELQKTVKEKTLYLEEVNARLRSLNRIKDEFIAITSHELRSPLTSIRGYLSFLVEEDSIGQMSEPYREYLIRAYSTTDALNYLINNILDVSRLDMGRFELQKQKVDIIKLIRSILDSLSFQVQERQVELEFENHTADSQMVVAIDSIRMSQVLRNVLDNAIKFTKKGKKIRVKVDSDGEWVCVNVADQGVGIPKTKLDHVFDKFIQVRNPQTRYKGGVGLGLFIAKRIVEMHGGKIKAEKNADKGATIKICLPINS